MPTRLAKPARLARASVRADPAETLPAGPRTGRSTLRRDLCSSTGDGVTFSLMVGLGETYLPAFVLAL